MENLHIVNLSQYNKPQIKEDKRKNWVAYGDDNNYYQYLIDLYINSTTNNAVINGVSNMIKYWLGDNGYGPIIKNLNEEIQKI